MTVEVFADSRWLEPIRQASLAAFLNSYSVHNHCVNHSRERTLTVNLPLVRFTRPAYLFPVPMHDPPEILLRSRIPNQAQCVFRFCHYFSICAFNRACRIVCLIIALPSIVFRFALAVSYTHLTLPTS